MDHKIQVKRLDEQKLGTVLPHVSVDCVIFGFHENQLRVLLLRLKNIEEWSLPGGRLFPDESLDDAADRVLRERTGLENIFLKQFYTFGDRNRMDNTDFHSILARQGIHLDVGHILFDRTISVGYYALVEFSQVSPALDELTEEWRWWDVRDVPAMIFDHNAITTTALEVLRRQLRFDPVGLNLLPEKFTMPELQKLYETILNKTLDRRNFQKRILGYGILTRLEERRVGGAHKSPYLYRFNEDQYFKALETGLEHEW